MATEEKIRGTSYIILTRREAADIISALGYTLANEGNMGAPEVSCTREDKSQYRLVLGVERHLPKGSG